MAGEVVKRLVLRLEWSGWRRGPGTSMGARNGEIYASCPVCGQLKEPNGDFAVSAVGHLPDCDMGLVAEGCR